MVRTSRIETEPGSPHSDDMARMMTIFFNQTPQPSDVHVERLCSFAARGVPNGAENMISAYHAVDICHQKT